MDRSYLYNMVFAAVVSTGLVANAATQKEITYKPVVSSYEKLPTPSRGGILYTGLSGNPKVMNPVISADNNSSLLEPFIWLKLMGEDLDTLNPIPQLAESYTISADKKSYTFVLNPAAKWQDGTPVTTEDVKFTFDTMMNPKTDAAPLRAYWEGVKLDVKDARTFTFSVPAPKFDTLRSLYLFTPINKKQFENEKDFNRAKGILQPIGNGPYKLASFQRDQKVELDAVPEWWGRNIANLKNRFNYDKIIFRLITDPNLLYERFLKSEIDVMSFGGPNLETYEQKVKGIDKAKVGKSPSDGKDVWAQEFKNSAPRGYSYVGWNQKRPIFQSAKTRVALAHLADVPVLIEKIFYGYHYQSTSPFGSLTLNSDPSLRKPGKMITYDPKMALKLLREDGWADTDKDNILDKTINGTRVKFAFTVIYNSNNPARGKIAQVLKENFKKAGIDMSIRAMEWNAFLGDIDKRDFDAVILGWTATPYPNPKQTWHTDAEANQGSNFISYSNKKVDALIDKANLEMDLKKRAKILHEINRIIYDDQPYLFLTEPRSLVAGFNKKLKSKVWAMAYDVDPPIDIYSAK